jgi:hypothetical protein
MKWSVLTKFIFRCGAGRDAQSRYYDHAVTHCDCMLFSGESRRGENVFQGNKHKVKGRQICKVLLSGLRGEREEGGGGARERESWGPDSVEGIACRPQCAAGPGPRQTHVGEFR